MQKIVCSLACVFAITALGLFLVSCNDGDSASTPEPTVDASGTWHGQSSAGVGFTANIAQSGANLGGSAVRADGIHGSIAGTVEGNHAKWNMIWDAGYTGTYEGTIEGNTMSGSFEERFNDFKETGTFVATR